MKKLLIVGVTLVLACTLLTACNHSIIDTTWNFNYGYIQLPTGEVVEGPVTSWCDYDDGDQLQVTINGVTYLTHASNVVLVSK